MIKFFRKIRQNLLSEGKTGKYFKYAIGEIILVVIGILIALSINNWKNYQDDRTEEQILLQNLQQEFTKNLNELNSDHKINIEMLNATYHFLETDMHKKSPKQIDSLMGKLSTFATFDPSIGYISQATSSGKLDLIQSDSLKIHLSQWSGELNDLKEDVVIRREHWLNHLLPIIRKHIPIRNSDATQHRPDYLRQKQITPMSVPEENYKEFITSLEVDGVIFDHYMNQYYVFINEENIKLYIQRVLDLIEKELK
ncbi:DUF6090 family protein [Psychroserpens sp.]|uniref:DUF6090 family protein n=1 Tax=Psychroserpens sp. TaxID=2020870 RepID=UPI00385FD542